ncbi:hypothetical protein [Coleofasciculus chthonoplastes]
MSAQSNAGEDGEAGEDGGAGGACRDVACYVWEAVGVISAFLY